MEHKNVSKKGDPVFALLSRCKAKYLEAYSPAAKYAVDCGGVDILW